MGTDDAPCSWTELVDGASDIRSVTLIERSDGKLLRFVDTGSNIEQQIIDDPTLAAEWTSPTTSTAVAGGADGIAVAGNGIVIRLFYGDGTAVKYIESDDDGATWSSATTIATLTYNVALALFAEYRTDWSVGSWIVGATTYDSGDYYAHLIYYDGSSWITRDYTANPGWIMAGWAWAGNGKLYGLVLGDPEGTTSILAATIAQSSGIEPDNQYADRLHGGIYGLRMAWAKIKSGLGGYFGMMAESAQGFGRVPGLFGLVRESAGHYSGVLITEPIMQPEWYSSGFGASYDWIDTAAGETYLVTATGVWRADKRTVSGVAYAPVKYRYDSGVFEMTLSADSAGGWSETFAVGNLLKVTRALEYQGQSDSESIRAIITRVQQSWYKTELVAYDALAYLGVWRARRTHIMVPNRNGSLALLGYVLANLAACAGVYYEGDYEYLISNAGMLNFSLKGGENIAAAIYRAGSLHRPFLVPRNDGTFQLIAVPVGYDQSDSEFESYTQDYETSWYSYGGEDHPLIDATTLANGLEYAFAHVMGQQGTDPDDGSGVAMAAGAVLPGVRPQPISITSRTLSSKSKTEKAATSEADRQKRLRVDATIETIANLGLELYDRVKVSDSRHGWDEKQFRVRRIRERWEQGRLIQTVYLGDLSYE